MKFKIKSKAILFYWFIPIMLNLLQAVFTLNSFNQMRFEEFIESVQAPFWLDQRLIISGLHVNVGWYAYLLLIYKIFGFSLHTGKITYLVMSIISTFCLAFLLKKFFEWKVASLILTTIVLSPTLLYMNTLNLHWAMTFHLLIIILLLLNMLDFSKRRQGFILTGIIFLLMMVMWFFYQAVVFYIPSLVIFYLFQLRQTYHDRGTFVQKAWPHLMAAIIAFLLPLVIIFIYVENRNILIADHNVGGGLFRGGGRFEFSENVFSQAWTDFISDFFIRGVSHHFEVYLAEFSLVFPIFTLLFILYALIKIYTAVGKMSKALLRMKQLILLAWLVICFDIVVFSTTSDLGLPGMKRVTPILVSTYFLWVLVWWAAEKRVIRGIGGIWVIRAIMGMLLVHHLIVYPVNLAHLKDPSPFKVTDWFDPAPYGIVPVGTSLSRTEWFLDGAGFDENSPQQSVEMYVKEAQKGDLRLDCRPIIAQAGGCSYDFIYPAVAGACKWNNLNCHDILGYDPKTGKFISLDVRLWEENYFEH